MTRLIPLLALCLAAAAQAAPLASSPVGNIYHYLRTNLDGSVPEHVYVFRRDAARIEVYKMVEKCTNAALVTADIDVATGHAPRITGGRLAPNAEQKPFAFLRHDVAKNRLAMRVELPNETLIEETQLKEPTFHLFDFDLADLTIFGPAIVASKTPHTFDMVLLWPPGKPGERLRNLGRAELRFQGEETIEGKPTLRYEATGPAFGGKGGPIWFDKADGHIVDVKWGIPNHAEYNSFRLKLQGIESGAAAWDKLLRGHFDGCK